MTRYEVQRSQSMATLANKYPKTRYFITGSPCIRSADRISFTQTLANLLSVCVDEIKDGINNAFFKGIPYEIRPAMTTDLDKLFSFLKSFRGIVLLMPLIDIETYVSDTIQKAYDEGHKSGRNYASTAHLWGRE